MKDTIWNKYYRKKSYELWRKWKYYQNENENKNKLLNIRLRGESGQVHISELQEKYE